MADERFWVKVSGMDRITKLGRPTWTRSHWRDLVPRNSGIGSCGATTGPSQPRRTWYPMSSNSSTSSPRSRRRRPRAMHCWSTTPNELYRFGRQDVSLRFKNKVAIVTGPAASARAPGGMAGPSPCASRRRPGSWRWIAPRPIRRDARAGRRVSRITITPWVCNVTSSDSVAAMAAACLDVDGTIDVLVNNVGGSAAGGPVELAEETWHLQIDLQSQERVPDLQARAAHHAGEGRGVDRQHLVDIGPAVDRRGAGGLCSDQGRRHPDVARVAVQHAARASGSTASCRDSCTRRWSRRAWQRSARAATSRHSVAGPRIPLGFMGDGRDTASAALFLASDEARFITGTEISSTAE